jgi:LysM repeat protein
MATPKQYFANPREADLAERVWRLSASLPGHYELHSTNEWFGNAWWPWVTKQIIYARDWITYYRELDGVGGVQTLNAQLGGTDFTAEEIGNVEHFYVAAMMANLGGPVGGVVLNAIGTTVWEMVIGPVRIAFGGHRPGVVWKNVKHNWGQLSGPDQAGTRFGAFYGIRELVEEFMKGGIPPVVKARVPPSIPPRWQHRVAPGEWLSKLAIKYYNDVRKWPIIYDANKQVIGNDPNKIKPGQVLAIPDLASVTAAEIAEAQRRADVWKR